MDCKKCGAYNNEDREVCRVCGDSLTDFKMSSTAETKKKKQNNVLRNVIILTLFGICVLIFMLSPTTHVIQESYNVNYQEPVYKTVNHNDPIYKDVFRTVTHKDPIYEDIYKTVTRKDPEYKTVRTYQIQNTIIKNVYDIKKEFTGTGGFWTAYNEYKVTVYYYDALSKTTKIFYEVPTSSIIVKDTYEAIVGYNTWTEQVLDGQKIVDYDTWTEQVPDGQEIIDYDTWTETVLEGHVTKTKKEYRNKTIDCLMYEKTLNLV